MSEHISEIEEQMVAAGVTEFEIFLVHDSIYENQFLLQDLDINKEGQVWSYTIRLLEQKGDKTGIGTVRGMSFRPREIQAVIQQAVTMATLNTEPFYQFPGPTSAYPSLESGEPSPADDPQGILSEQTGVLLNALPAAGVTPTFGKLRLVLEERWLRNSTGVDASAADNHWFIEFALKAEAGTKKAEFWGTHYSARVMDLQLEERIPTWGTYAQDALSAELPSVEEGTVIIFPPKVLAEALVPVIGYHASSAARQENTTRFDTIGTEVARPDFSLWDDGLLAGGLGSAPWDGEGVTQQRTPIIADGQFQGWLYDQRQALIFGEAPTGNGIRGGSGDRKSVV